MEKAHKVIGMGGIGKKIMYFLPKTSPSYSFVKPNLPFLFHTIQFALSLKGDGNALIKGGGAQSASDKVIQHNGKGTVTIDGFQVSDFGKLYRACGNCKNSVSRSVVIKNVKAYSGKVLAGINPNFGGTATISSTCASSVKTICEEFKGTTPGNEPQSVSKGPSNNCKYTASAIKSC